MAATELQLEENKRSNPRYVLDHHMIRGMILEADIMDKNLFRPALRSILTQSAGPVPIRRPTTEELTSAKRWVEEQKTAFNRSSYNYFPIQLRFSNRSRFLISGFEGVAGYPQVPETETQEYDRNLQHLDLVLGSIEKYIHVAFAVIRKEEVIRRMFTMVSGFDPQPEDMADVNGRVIDGHYQIPA